MRAAELARCGKRSSRHGRRRIIDLPVALVAGNHRHSHQHGCSHRLILTTTADIRTEAQADRAAAQADRAAAQAATEANRAAAQAAAEASRVAFEAEMRAMHERTDAERRRFEAEILGLTRE